MDLETDGKFDLIFSEDTNDLSLVEGEDHLKQNMAHTLTMEMENIIGDVFNANTPKRIKKAVRRTAREVDDIDSVQSIEIEVVDASSARVYIMYNLEDELEFEIGL